MYPFYIPLTYTCTLELIPTLLQFFTKTFLQCILITNISLFEIQAGLTEEYEWMPIECFVNNTRDHLFSVEIRLKKFHLRNLGWFN